MKKRILLIVTVLVASIMLGVVLASCNNKQENPSGEGNKEVQCVHDFVKTDVVNGNCRSKGYTKSVCALCGEEKIVEDANYGLHSYQAHVCLVCGLRENGDEAWKTGEVNANLYVASSAIGGEKTYDLVINGNGKTGSYSHGGQPWAGYIEMMRSVRIEEGVTELGDGLFENGVSLRTVVIANSVKSIGERTFYNCVSVDSVTIGEGVESVGKEAFAGCGAVRDLFFHSAAVKFGDGVFNSCNALRNLSIGLPGRIDEKQNLHFGRLFGEGDGAQKFSENNVQYSYAVPTSLAFLEIKGEGAIPASCFKKCNAFSKLTFSGKVTEIGKEAFFGCEKLKEVVFGEQATNSLAVIGSYAFSQCRNLGSELENEDEKTVENAIYLPNGLTELGERAFAGCNRMTKAVFSGNGLKTLSLGAFSSCGALEKIVLPESLTSIGAYAFENAGLTEIIIGKNVETLGIGAFSNCSKLKQIFIDSANVYAKDASDKSNVFVYPEKIWVKKEIVPKGTEREKGSSFVKSKCAYRKYDEESGYHLWLKNG